MVLIRPGKPTDNAILEAFNSRFRQECLNKHWFLSVRDAQKRVEEGQRYYNEGASQLFGQRGAANFRCPGEEAPGNVLPGAKEPCLPE